MSLEAIRKAWVMVGTFILALNFSWIPDIVKGVFAPEATEVIFAAIGAVVAAYQFFKKRTGEGQPQALHKGGSSVIGYMINPFASASK